MRTNYPIYIVSKGRHKSRLTAKALERMNVDYYIVVEKQEYDLYCSVIQKEKVLILDAKYQDEYETCDDLGSTKSKGPGEARNFACQHSISSGFKRHWVMDDNIHGFHRLNRNEKNESYTGAIFEAAEDFIDRYENIAIAGLNYKFFAKASQELPPFICNTRIYSCLLIQNDIPYRWRGRYNEDTDLSLRVLKDGLCTLQFNAFLQDKAMTQTIAGGNTEEFYKHEGTKAKSQMIEDLHPDVCSVVYKFGRWHHHCNYSFFKKNNKLRRKQNYVFKQKVNNYGMKLSAVIRSNPQQIRSSGDLNIPP